MDVWPVLGKNSVANLGAPDSDGFVDIGALQLSGSNSDDSSTVTTVSRAHAATPPPALLHTLTHFCSTGCIICAKQFVDPLATGARQPVVTGASQTDFLNAVLLSAFKNRLDTKSAATGGAGTRTSAGSSRSSSDLSSSGGSYTY